MAIVLGIFNNPEGGGGGSPTVISLLDDFRDMRTNGDGGNLWQPYLGEGNTGQVTTIVSNELRTQTGASPSNFLLQFFPRDAGYPYPAGYTHNWVRDANYVHTMNRLVWIQRWSISRTRNASKTDNIQLGTYVKDHQDPTRTDQGNHFYHLLNAEIVADRWYKIWMDDKPQHQVGAPGEYGPDPLYATQGEHYFHALTRWYIDHQPLNQGWGDHRVDVAGFHFLQIDDEPTALVSTVMAGYDGTKYDVSWSAPGVAPAITYDVRYSTTSMKNGGGFLTGTDGGQVSSRGDAYKGVDWQSPTMAEANPGLFVAIRPVGETLFTEKYIPYNLGPSNYSDDGY
jgi:hypothetical protein